MAYRIQLIVFGAFVAACGLDVVGVAPVEGDAGTTADGGGRSEAGASSGDAVDAGPSPPANCSVATCDALALAAPGFTQVAFGAATSPCPTGFDDAPVFEDPKPKTGSCACGDCTYQGGSCATAHVQSRSGSSAGSCSKNNDAVDFATGRCTPYSGYWANVYAAELTPAPEAVGTCSAPAMGVRAQVDVAAERVCTRHADTCAASMCGLPAGLQVCLAAPGDVACPKGAPKKHAVGPDFTLDCGVCGCTPATTCAGTMSWWKNSSNCTGEPDGKIPSDTCTLVNGASIAALRWDAQLAQTCKTKPADKAKAALAKPMTVCCPR